MCEASARRISQATREACSRSSGAVGSEKTRPPLDLWTERLGRRRGPHDHLHAQGRGHLRHSRERGVHEVPRKQPTNGLRLAANKPRKIRLRQTELHASSLDIGDDTIHSVDLAAVALVVRTIVVRSKGQLDIASFLAVATSIPLVTSYGDLCGSPEPRLDVDQMSANSSNHSCKTSTLTCD
jgi:hypothetical protein